MRKLHEVSIKTLDKTKEYLDKYGRCLVVRPTGFGKSYMLAHLSKRYKKSIYVYPLDIIKESVIATYGPEGSNVMSNVEFVSYQRLNNIYKDNKIVEFMKQFDIIMLDEVHMAGAEGFRNIFKEIDKLISKSKIHLVGVTATPDRADNFDVKYEYFKGKEIFQYTLHNCVKDNIMKAPHYRRGIFDVGNVINSSIGYVNNIRRKNGHKDIDDMEKYKIAQEANILNAADIIKGGIDNVYGTTRDYFKFIVFFPNIQATRDRSNEVKLWFKEKFNNFNIEIVTLHSDVSDDDVDNIEALEKLKYKRKTIQLIMCVDMLNMGYHVNDITGVIMLRSTRSDIIYKQQIGRCLSVKSEYPALIFDLVDNINIKPYFMKDGKSPGGTGDARDIINERQRFIGGDSIILKDETASFSTLVNRMGYAPEINKTKSIIWWYTNRKAPLYIIEDIFNMKKGEVIKVLEKANIKIEDETKTITSLTNKEVIKRLYNPKDGRRKSS